MWDVGAGSSGLLGNPSLECSGRERPAHSSDVWRDTRPSESARVQTSGAKPLHLWNRKAKHGYGKEGQMITILGVKIPWESRQGKQREGMRMWQEAGSCHGDAGGHHVGSGHGFAPALQALPCPRASQVAHMISTQETPLTSNTQYNPPCSHPHISWVNSAPSLYGQIFKVSLIIVSLISTMRKLIVILDCNFYYRVYLRKAGNSL